ncbi:MAG: hypothetical protein JST00_18190 [Deltaproteobacteria bacterium]|nr:hypothetical protein [Deltaproteobacteria bacterium]
MRHPFRPAGLFVAALSFALAACGSAQEEETTEGADEVVKASATPQLCAGVRGNGQSILTHFASLSQIVEHYGVVDGMAGGSSGSITTFTYESILKNPVVRSCGGKACSRADAASRLALTLKSAQGYAEAVGDSEEGVAIKGLVTTAMKLKAEYDARGIGALGTAESAEAAKRLKEVLSIPEVKGIVNPEALKMLSDPANLTFNVNEIKTSIVTLGAFSVDDNRLFFRTGILNWPALAQYFGRVGDFYAGYGPSDKEGMRSWLDKCAEPTRGKPWSEAKDIAVDGGTCGSLFKSLVDGFRAKARTSEGTYASRIDERVGDPKSPLHKLVSTAVLERDAVTKWKAARARYAKGEFPTGNVPFEPAFGDVNFGYWGSDADLARVQENQQKFDDLKTKKFSSLGNSAWREILSASPAEPGLSRFVELSDGRISAGGWSDLTPALVLKNMGCAQVVLVTREGDESGFATKIAKHAGMSESDWSGLYDLTNPASGYSRSVETADAVWCTNWNAFPDSQMGAMVLDAFNAPLEARASFTARAIRPYSRVTDRTGKAGCTPGIGAGATYPR